jgi:hypothetical protein
MLRRRSDDAYCVRRDPASYVQGPRSRVVRSRSLVDNQRPTIAALQGQPSSARSTAARLLPLDAIHPRVSTGGQRFLIGDADGLILISSYAWVLRQQARASTC